MTGNGDGHGGARADRLGQSGDGDRLQRFLFEGFPVRGHLVHLDASWRALIEHHGYPPLVRDTLGEAMAATALLVATLKFEGLLTLQMQGNGPMHLLVAQGTHKNSLRGVARYTAPPASRDLRELLGQGQMTVTLENADRSSRYQGVVPLIGGRISECLEEYFRRSEQLPSRLWLAATPERAAGLLLQRLPVGATSSAEQDLMEVAEADEDWRRVVMLADTLTNHELVSLGSGELVRRLFHEEDVRVYDPSPVYFQCTCSRERVVGILRSLGREEIDSIVAERGSVEVRCEFCNRAYRFDAVDAVSVFQPIVSVPVPPGIQ
jgi:molecular chaperone Hsp33